MKLILVRHGQTEENKNHIWQGHLEGTLSKEGREQARKLANRLEKENILRIYCSDLRRTRNTIKPFLENHNIEIEYVEGLRERNLGVLEGATTEQVEEYKAKHKIHFRISNLETGETNEDVKKRLVKLYQEVANKYEEGTILFVTHGGTIAQLLLYLLNHPLDKFMEFVPNNASVTEIEIKEGKPELKLFNDTSHL